MRHRRLRDALAPTELATGVGRVRAARYLRDRAVTWHMRSSFGSWLDGSLVQQPLWIEGDASGIHVGEHVTMGPSTRLGCFSGGEIHFGDECEMTGNLQVIAHREPITFGRGVLIGWGVQAYNGDHRRDRRDVYIRDQGMAPPRPITVKDGAQLGAGVFLCNGVTIGRNAVVGANAVVTKDVPDYAVAVGIPARA